MQRKKLFLCSAFLASIIALPLSACSNESEGGDNGGGGDNPGSVEEIKSNHNPFDYEGNFKAPELSVDGIRDEVYDTEGSQVLYVEQGTDHELSATFYRGEEALFVFFEVKDTNILTLSDNGGDDVTHGDSVEFYLDTKNDGGAHPQTDDFQFNFGVNNKTRIMQGSGYEWGNWNGLVQYENVINGTINDDSDTDTGWTCEAMVTYADLGITKDSTIGIALGRVDKFGKADIVEQDWRWYGLTFDGLFVEPQTIDNYISLVGKTFYLRENLPLIKTVNGIVVDSAGNVLSDVKVTVEASQSYETTTGSDGKFTFENIPLAQVNKFTFSKEGYSNYVVEVTKEEASATQDDLNLGTITLIKDDESIKTTFTGVVSNVTNGLLKGATVKLNETSVSTDDNGAFSLPVQFSGNAVLTVSLEGYIEESFTIDSSTIVQNGTTQVGTLDLKLDWGEFDFALSTEPASKLEVPDVHGQVTRSSKGIIFRFTSEKEIIESVGGWVELYIDAKSSGTSRDATDYQFNICSDGTILSASNFGGGQVDRSLISNKVITSEEGQYTFEFFIDYDAVGVSAGEVVGFSAGCHYGIDWDGFDFEGYVAPENPTQYLRIGIDNQLYKAVNNIGGAVDPFVYTDLGEFGVLVGGAFTSITRDIDDALFFKFVKTEGWSADYKIEFYIDTNTIPVDVRNEKTFRIDVWGNGEVSLFENYNNGADGTNFTETAGKEIITNVSGDTLTMQIPYEILNIKSNQTIGVSQGLWQESIKKRDGWGYKANGYPGFIAPEIPSEYVRINGNCEVTKDYNTYTDLGTVGGKSNGEITATALKMDLSREQTDYMTLKVKNQNHKWGEVQNPLENLEFYFDVGARDRFGDVINDNAGVFRDAQTIKMKVNNDATIDYIHKYGEGEPRLDKEQITVTKLDDNTITIQIPYALIGATNETEIGFSCGVWSEQLRDWCMYTFNGRDRRVENIAQYLRVDGQGNILAD